MQTFTPPTGPPKSKRRHVMDACLFGGLSLIFIWAALDRAREGEVDLRRGGLVRLSDDPVQFWAWMAAHVFIVAICGWLSRRAFQAAKRAGSESDQ